MVILSCHDGKLGEFLVDDMRMQLRYAGTRNLFY